MGSWDRATSGTSRPDTVAAGNLRRGAGPRSPGHNVCPTETHQTKVKCRAHTKPRHWCIMMKITLR